MHQTLTPSTEQAPTHPVERLSPERAERDRKLEALFGVDLSFVQNDLQIFHHDPEKGVDGLLHTLIGDQHGGFHAESASTLLKLDGPENLSPTKVDRTTSHLPSKRRRAFRQYPFEPHGAQVTVEGRKKLGVIGGTRKGVVNSMFPAEYDPTAIVRSIAIAYDNMNMEEAERRSTPDGDILLAQGQTTMLDEETKMTINMHLDPYTKKIMSAYPQLSNNGARRMAKSAYNNLL